MTSRSSYSAGQLVGALDQPEDEVSVVGIGYSVTRNISMSPLLVSAVLCSIDTTAPELPCPFRNALASSL
jgi:hypothetical protein